MKPNEGKANIVIRHTAESRNGIKLAVTKRQLSWPKLGKNLVQ